MKHQRYRLPDGGRIDRTSPVRFTFDGKSLEGYKGDTLASALLANGRHLLGRSFKYHRRRGVFSAGPEEPNALVTLGADGADEPNIPATMVPLSEGLVARSQNAWPSLRFDLLSVNSMMKPLLPAGFYYKTFMWPRKAWYALYEPMIRRAAGMGEIGQAADTSRYERRHAHCDVLVVGAGPAGLMAALAASKAGARVILADDRDTLGGSLFTDNVEIDNQPGVDWATRLALELSVTDKLQVLRCTTVFGQYDGLTFGAVERVADRGDPGETGPRERSWVIHAAQAVIATGAVERPMTFAGNDKPGIMLAGAARRYLNQYGVRPGRQVAVVTNNDDAYRTAIDYADAGADVTLVDTRAQDTAPASALIAHKDIRTFYEHGVVTAGGKRRVKRLTVGSVHAEEKSWKAETIGADLVCVSAGWSPTNHLLSHLGKKPTFDPDIGAPVSREPGGGLHVCGGAAGTFDLHKLIETSVETGRKAANAAGRKKRNKVNIPWTDDPVPYAYTPYWRHPGKAGDTHTSFVDMQHDVTVADLELAAQEGFHRPDHAKRYTTLGMATDQGKLSNVNALGLLAEMGERGIGDIGTTTYRPPYAPVALGAIAGSIGADAFRPTRVTPFHRWHKRLGAVFTDAGLWRRAYYYSRHGPDFAGAVAKEVEAVRETVGVVDVSTLGKFEVRGPDAATFLDRVYAGPLKSLKPGCARYGLMLREDGILFDDGTVSRLADDHYVLTTSTAHTAAVAEHLDHAAQVTWPDLDVALSNVTEQWAQIAVSGPKARHVVSAIVDGLELNHEDFPPLTVGSGRFGNAPVRVFRLSFSGELAYELAVPARRAEALWEAVMEAGVNHGIMPYGTEAMTVLRTEKGHIAGPEIDGRTTAEDLGLSRFVSKKKDYIGRRMSERSALTDADRLQLVGLLPPGESGKTIRAGSHLVTDPSQIGQSTSEGHVTTAVFSPTLGHDIALGMLKRGRDRHFDRIYAVFPMRNEVVELRVRDPFFIDPRGARADV